MDFPPGSMILVSFVLYGSRSFTTNSCIPSWNGFSFGSEGIQGANDSSLFMALRKNKTVKLIEQNASKQSNAQLMSIGVSSEMLFFA